MRYLLFELTMPNPPTWNGHWKGENDKHTKAIAVDDKDFAKLPDIINQNFYYRWNDGWTALIKVSVTYDYLEKEKFVRGSKGFCGYDWMIKTLMKYGEIRIE